MIGRVYFKLESGETITPYETYGIFLKSYDALPPAPKTFRVDIEGADGSIDLSEWTGDVRFQDRILQIGLLDTIGNNQYLLSKISGRRCKIWFSDDNDYYYVGRCNDIDKSTRRHISDIAMSFICEPWKYCKEKNTITKAVTSGGITLSLRAKRMPVVPTIVLTGTCVFTVDGNTYNLSAGTHKPYWLALSDTMKEVSITGSGNVTVEWRDGVI